jgi:hypothetical protein
MPPTVLPIRLTPKRESQRDLLLVHAPESAALRGLSVPGSNYFVALLAWDSEDVHSAELARIARLLLDSGCVYFCCWGSGCERLHDAIDEEYATEGITVNDDESTIMTTWHDDESLEEAARFVAHNAYPDDRFIHDCNTVLAVAVGSGEHRHMVGRALLVAHGAA